MYPSPANIDHLGQGGNVPPITPQLHLENEMRKAKSLFDSQHKRLADLTKAGRMSREEYESQRMRLQAEVDKFGTQYQQKAAALKRIEQMQGLGLVTDPEKIQRAMWSTILPPEAMRELFKEDQAESASKPLTPGQLNAYYASVGDVVMKPGEMEGGTTFAQKLFTTPKRKWSKGRLTKKELMGDYQRWRSGLGYDDMSPVHKAQLDHQWDSWMEDQANPGYDEKGKPLEGTKMYSNWDPDDPAIKALRPQGRLAAAFSGNPIDQTPMKTSDRMNPIQQSIAGQMPEKKPADEMISVIAPNGQTGKIPRSKLQQALTEGFKVVE